MSIYRRHPQTGELVYKLTIDVHLAGEKVPWFIGVADWPSAIAYLSSPEFRRIRSRAETVTIRNQEKP